MATNNEFDYDTVVIGAGVEGSATAFQLSRRDVSTLLLEQFPLPHSRGSSHGQTRVIRKAYPEAIYCHMMNYCSDAWLDIQETARSTILKQVGYLAIGTEGGPYLRSNMMEMSKHGQEYRLLSPDQLAKAYPMLRYPPTTGGLYDPNGGILMADKALRALWAQGGHLKDNEKMLKVLPGDVVQVVTSRGSYRCRSVILCCGPWTNAVLRPLGLRLPLQPMRISVCYWREKVPGSYGLDKLPTFFEYECCESYSIYGLPSDEYPGHVKLCLHAGPDIDPESRDSVDTMWVERLISAYVREHFPGLESKPSIVETCIYTNTPDCHFIMDCHPVWKNIVIGAGFSGHGFKLAPAVGCILSDLATGRKPSYDVSHFRISRFDGLETRPSKL